MFGTVLGFQWLFVTTHKNELKLMATDTLW